MEGVSAQPADPKKGLPDIGLLEITNEKDRTRNNRQDHGSQKSNGGSAQTKGKNNGTGRSPQPNGPITGKLGNEQKRIGSDSRKVSTERFTPGKNNGRQRIRTRNSKPSNPYGWVGQGRKNGTNARVNDGPKTGVNSDKGVADKTDTNTTLQGKDYDVNNQSHASDVTRGRLGWNEAIAAEKKENEQFDHHRSDSEPSKDLLPSTEAEKDLERRGIFKLQKRKAKFPRAKYFCRLCNYHMDTIEDCEEHASQTRHIRLMKNKIVADNFKSVPKLSPSHEEALTSMLEDLVREVGLTDEMMEERQEVAERVNIVIQRDMPDCLVDLYGSSLSGFGLKTSGVNLNIKTIGKHSAAELLLTAYDVLEKEKKAFKSLGCFFEDKFPVIYFTDRESNIYCELGTGSEYAVSTSHILLKYRNLDARVRNLGIAFRYWAQLLEIDRPKDGSLPPYVYSLLAVYFLQRCVPPVVPVLQESERLTGKNEQSLGALWVAIFHCYLVERNLEEEVICIKNRVAPSRKDLNVHNRRIVVEDPCAQSKKAITKYLSSAEVLGYIMDCLHIGLEFFSAQKRSGDYGLLNQGVNLNEKPFDLSQTLADESRNSDFLTEEDGSIGGSESRTENATVENLILEQEGDVEHVLQENSTSHIRTNNSQGSLTNTNDDLCTQSRNEHNCIDSLTQSSHESIGKAKPLPEDFSFDKDKLTNGEKVPKICSNCLQEGHLAKDCEDDMLPGLAPLPPMENWYLIKIQQLCELISDHFAPQKWEIEERNFVIRDLESFIQVHCTTSIKLALFGSSVNGFGFQTSDLDICMTFTNNATGEGLNVPDIIQTLAQFLRKHPQLYSVIPITTAKVPIVKFVHRPTQLEGDISLYNLLAQHNTQLLKTYSQIDRRVCRLGHMVKAFAKECGIADASRGSLSSYAYILMTLYFLQQIKPPVIPVLQELYESDQKPERLVEGRNTWFFENTRMLRNVWKGLGKNQQAEAELWVRFLRFYTEEFDWSKYVVCIRQQKILTRFEKMWMGVNRGFAIEDPFDLDHNLGGALSRKMTNYIMLIFRKGRERFGTPQNVPIKFYNFFLDYDYLTDGQQPPNDRGCRICGKIGHFVKDCPIKLRGKEKKRAKASTPQKNPQESSESTKPQETKQDARQEPASNQTSTASTHPARGGNESRTENQKKSDTKGEPSEGRKMNHQTPTKTLSNQKSTSNRMTKKSPERNSGESRSGQLKNDGGTPLKNQISTDISQSTEIPIRQVQAQPRHSQTPPRQTKTPTRQSGTPIRQVVKQTKQMHTPNRHAPQGQPQTPTREVVTPPRHVVTPPRQVVTPPRQIHTPHGQSHTPPMGQFQTPPMGQFQTPPMGQFQTPPRHVPSPHRQFVSSPMQPMTPPSPMMHPSLMSLSPIPYGVRSPGTASPRHAPQSLMSLPLPYPAGSSMYPSSPGPQLSRPLLRMPYPPLMSNQGPYMGHQAMHMNRDPIKLTEASAELQKMLGMTPSSSPQSNPDMPKGPS